MYTFVKWVSRYNIIQLVDTGMLSFYQGTKIEGLSLIVLIKNLYYIINIKYIIIIINIYSALKIVDEYLFFLFKSEAITYLLTSRYLPSIIQMYSIV